MKVCGCGICGRRWRPLNKARQFHPDCAVTQRGRKRMTAKPPTGATVIVESGDEIERLFQAARAARRLRAA